MQQNEKNVETYYDNIGDEKISLQVSDLSSTPYHRHTFLEIAYVIDGSATHYFNSGSVTVKKGDYYAIDYGEVHKYSPCSPAPADGKFKVINCIFRPEFIDASLKNCRGFFDLISNYRIKFEYESLASAPTKVIFKDDTKEVLLLFEKMLKEYTAKQPRFSEVIRCNLIELIIVTLRKIHNETEAEKPAYPIQKVVEYIEQNYMKKITLSEISAKLGYSLPYISSLFSKTHSLPFSQYLKRIRVEKACRMLENTDKNIDDIANLVGYGDVKHFRIVFRCIVGKSPSEYRRSTKI